MEDAALLTLAADLARRAGAVILAVRARGFETTRKSDASPVTEADHAAEALIVQGLRAATPGIPVVAEEEHAAGAVAAEHHEYWLVDPLDGTTNFIHGIPVFAVSIAFCEPDNKGGFIPRHGIVYDPMRDEAFTGEANAGVWLNGERVWTSGCATLSAAVVATALPFRFPAELDAAAAVFLQVQKACDDQRRGGSAALDLAYTAVGRLDGYYELGIYPWDTAAGELLVGPQPRCMRICSRQ